MKMKHKATHLGVAAVCVAVILLLALTIPQSATLTSGTAPVTVVNTPLPVTLQGTGTITGDVNATQSGSWNVGVTSLPAVQLAAGTTVGINGGSLALDDPAKTAYAVTLCATDTDDCAVNPSTATLPVGTRFVIEVASGDCFVRNEGIHGWTLGARLNGVDHEYQISDKISSHDDDSARGLFFNQGRIYADGGVVSGLSVHLVSAGFFESHDLGPEGVCNITLSGYLVSMPTPFPTAP
jgi:hypothetical protein